VAKSTPDFANLVQGTQKTVTDQLTANPNLKAFWFAFDTTGIAAGQVIGSKYPGKSFPDKPLLVTFHGDLGTLDLVRKGDIDAVGEVDYDAGAWIGMDQLNEFFARGKAVDPQHQPSYGDAGQLYSYSVVTKDSVPPQGKYTAPTTDVVSFFKSKWKTEYGVG
jgi:ABC-type sugar transport system substrate-binding protein